jgi:hypothetical protein
MKKRKAFPCQSMGVVEEQKRKIAGGHQSTLISIFFSDMMVFSYYIRS